MNLAVHGEAPLRGKKIVVTRAKSQAGGLGDELAALGAEVLTLPTIKIAPVTPTDLPVPHPGDSIIFTSANVVEHYVRCLVANGTDLEALRAADVCAISRPRPPCNNRASQ